MLVYGQHDSNVEHILPRYNNNNVFVKKTVQDSLGFIWMITGDGILKYNGYNYSLVDEKEIFLTINPIDEIDDIVVDSLNNIWIKTSQGLLSKYVWDKGVFEDVSKAIGGAVSYIKCNRDEVWIITKKGVVKRYANNIINKVTELSEIGLSNARVSSMAFVQNKEVYFGTTQGKVYSYAIKEDRLKELKGAFTNYPTNVVLEVDPHHRLWIGTEAHGLLIYDVENGVYIEKDFFKGEKHEVDKALFLDLFLDSNGYIWGGTDGDGLYKMHTSNGNIVLYRNNNANSCSLGSNTIIDVNEDNNQNIWVVTKYFTVDVIPKVNENIGYHKGSANNSTARILSIFKGSDDVLWVGTDGNGLTRIDQHSTQQFFNEANTGFYVQSITDDNLSNLWIGTYKNGLWHYAKKTGMFEKVHVFNELNQEGTDVRTVFKDSQGRVWVGSNVSLNIYDETKKLLASFNNKDNGLKGAIVESIIEDKKGTIWIGQLGGGLYKFEENQAAIARSTFLNFDVSEELPRVRSMCLGKDNQIWMLTGNNSLTLFDSATHHFEKFNHLIPGKRVSLMAILSADADHIWISSTNGILHFNVQKKIIRTFNTTDGLSNNSFMIRSAFKDKEGLLYFGSTKGIHFFLPEKLNKNKSKAKLVVNDIRVLNKPAKEILPKQVTSDVSNLNELHLKNNQSSFSVRFSAIDNVLHPNHYYEYQLKGFDKDRKVTYAEGLAEYTNVPSGIYTLEIKVYDIDEKRWIASKNMVISIAPPFWNTPIAYLVYLLFFAGVVWGIVKWYYLKKKLLIHRISRRKEKELHKAKMNFFTKMSHEIQTPITLILGPIDDMLKQSDLNGNLLLKERLHIIANNAKRLSRIARELTLVRNKELNKLQLSVTQNDLYKNISKICLSFKELARSKNIDFTVNCPRNIIDSWYDKEKLEHVLYNLLSNAFKYTPVEGNVQLLITPYNEKNAIKIAVTDSGSGIEKDELDKIFKIFYRSKDNLVKGMGIGLALTKELVTLHKGKIKVSSTPGEGTTFTVKIPISEEAYEDSEKISFGKKEELPAYVDNKAITHASKSFDTENKTILIVEDNFELQVFLKKLLEKEYNILLADNGKEGFYHAKNNIPDLIISDIMMPEMDGIEMCKELNKDTLTKHVPIILLTAKNSTHSKIEGLKTGAIEYINKPFNTNELLLKIGNILSTKENIISKYRKELINKPEIKISKSQDEVFLEKLTSHINERLADSNFKVDELADVINMSYSSLYRKCMSLTGYSLIDYIKILRLKKAAILMVKYGYNISETAYRVGFNDPKYFSKSFKKQFNITPKEFKNKAAEIDNIEKYLKLYGVDITDLDTK